MSIDVTDKKSIEEDLAKQQAFLRTVIDEIPSVIVVKNYEGNFLLANSTVANLYKTTPEDMIGKSDKDYIPKEQADFFKKNIQEIIKSGKQTTVYEDSTDVKTGETRHFHSIKKPLKDKYGNDEILVIATDITDMIKMNEKLDYISNFDELTGLPNREFLLKKIDYKINTHKQQKFAVLFLDIDNFKHINNSYGHTIGDKILKVFANRINKLLNSTDILSRASSDEFHLSTSIGVSLYPKDNRDPAKLIELAESAMYEVKRDGKNGYHFYSKELDSVSFERVFLETGLKNSISNDELVLHYQPQIEASTKKIVGLEALIRWKHPTLGLISPDKFIPLSEETKLIIPIGEFVLERAFKDLKKLQELNLYDGIMAVNVSSIQIKNSEFTNTLKKCVEKYNIDTQYLELELTESTLAGTNSYWINMLHEIKSLGFSIAIDDFGTGYSSLNYIHKLPIDRLKIDMSFVQELKNDDTQMLVKTIIDLSKNFKFKTIAEGIEEEFQETFLESNGCDMYQGYRYAKPLQLSKLIDFLQKRHT